MFAVLSSLRLQVILVGVHLLVARFPLLLAGRFLLGGTSDTADST